MSLKVIKGGKAKELLTAKERIERVKLLKEHVRDIESNMSLINQEAKRIDWKELEALTQKAKDAVVSVLGLIKNTEKSGFITSPFKKRNESQLRVVKHDKVEKQILEDIITEFEEVKK